MAKNVQIEYRTVQIPSKIEVDGESYPISQRNVDVIREYESSKDEQVLEKLVNFAPAM